MNKPIALDASWSLHGAKNTAELNAVLNALRDDAQKDALMSYSDIAGRTSVDRSVVVEISTWYQSLWMAA